jgi:hypothetical protein
MKITIEHYDQTVSVEIEGNDLTIDEAMDALVKPAISAVYSSYLVNAYFGTGEEG